MSITIRIYVFFYTFTNLIYIFYFNIYFLYTEFKCPDMPYQLNLFLYI